MTEDDSLVWDGDVPMQFAGGIAFADSTHDTFVFTYKNGGKNITSLLNFGGPLEKYKDDERHSVKLCFEEVPFTEGVADVHLDNITTTDGKTLLTATKPVYWEGCYFALEKDRLGIKRRKRQFSLQSALYLRCRRLLWSTTMG